ncbi:MAG TPA: hemerythrin domain-containing protein [Chloroflexota bacterium]|nr:hemerythrin domain-containing protein [Chloroflexota bacterium]
MEATDILKHEHRAIESVLDSLDKAAEALKQGKEVPAWIFAGGLDFISNFADRCHHGKEEGRLFPMFGERGVSVQGGPIAVMLAEHDEGRRYAREAAESYAKWTAGDRAAGAAMADALRKYTALLREHIYKEDNILYPMGDRFLSEDDDQALVRQFDEVEEHEMGPGVHERYHAMIGKLEEETAKL